jgi:hypothetical protein
MNGQIQTLKAIVSGNSTAISTLADKSSAMGDNIKTRFNYHKNALGDLGLWLGIVGVVVQTLQTSLDALDTNIEGQLLTLNETVSVNSTVISSLDTNVNGQIQTLKAIVSGNSTAISTLADTSSAMGDELETRFNHHKNALSDLGLGLGLMGVIVQTLQTSLDALDTNIEGQLQTLNEDVSVNSTAISSLDTNVNGQIQTLKAIVSGNSTAISTLTETPSVTGDIKMRLDYHKNALGDLGLGLGLVGVTVQTLHASLGALDANIEGKLRTLNDIFTTTSEAIYGTDTSSSAMGDIEMRLNYHKNALGDLGLGLGLVGSSVENLYFTVGGFKKNRLQTSRYVRIRASNGGDYISIGDLGIFTSDKTRGSSHASSQANNRSATRYGISLWTDNRNRESTEHD